MHAALNHADRPLACMHHLIMAVVTRSMSYRDNVYAATCPANREMPAQRPGRCQLDGVNAHRRLTPEVRDSLIPNVRDPCTNSLAHRFAWSLHHPPPWCHVCWCIKPSESLVKLFEERGRANVKAGVAVRELIRAVQALSIQLCQIRMDCHVFVDLRKGGFQVPRWLPSVDAHCGCLSCGTIPGW